MNTLTINLLIEYARVSHLTIMMNLVMRRTLAGYTPYVL